MVNFFEKNFTYYFNNLKQDPIIEFQKSIEFQLMQFALEVPILECSYLKYSQGILGINYLFFWGIEATKIINDIKKNSFF
jgi:hypothetical protein